MRVNPRLKFKTVSTNYIKDFDEEVCKALRQGWTLHGHPFILVGNSPIESIPCQAMTKMTDDTLERLED